MSNNIVCSVVVPMFNEQEVVMKTYQRLKEVMDKTGEAYELVFVNDGSKDATASILQEICRIDPNVKMIDFSRNFGHQIAITAGMDYSSGDSVVVIDGDLQDPPEVIPLMLQKWREGFDVVYGKRLKRKGDTFFKKATAAMFYRFLRMMTDVDIPVDTGDFRLIDRKVCDAMKRVNEKNRYIRGLISWLGFKQAAVEFERDKRFAGETKYPFKKMLKFAFDAITSFSYKPLKLATYLGFTLSVLSFLYLIFNLYLRIFTNITTSGWTSIIAVNLLFNGFVLIILGIIGEYVGRIYDETKNRPIYVVRELVNFEANDKNKLSPRG